MKNIKYLMLAGAALNMAACGGGSDDVENDVVEIIEEVDNSGNVESPATPTTPVVNPVEVVTGDNLTEEQFHNIFASEERVWRVESMAIGYQPIAIKYLMGIKNKPNSSEKEVTTCLARRGNGADTSSDKLDPVQFTLGQSGYMYPEWGGLPTSGDYGMTICESPVTTYSYDGQTATYHVDCDDNHSVDVKISKTDYPDIYQSDLSVISSGSADVNVSGKACSTYRLQHFNNSESRIYYTMIGDNETIPYMFQIYTANIAPAQGVYDLPGPTPIAVSENRNSIGHIQIKRYTADAHSPLVGQYGSLRGQGVLTLNSYSLDDVMGNINIIHSSGDPVQISFDSNL